MANVKIDETPALIIESGNFTYLCYPDFGVPTGEEGEAMEEWAVKRIDESVSGKTVITWAGGTTSKVHSVNNVSGLTFKYLL